MTSSLFDQETALAAPTSLAPVRFSMIGAAHPITGGVAPFNEAIVRAMRARGPADFISWNRLYPPLLRRGEQTAPEPGRPGHEPAPRLLDWHDPRTWRRAMTRVLDFGAQALVLPWLHPVMTPPFRWMLRHAPRDVSRVVICHNVELHERLPGAAMLTRAVLRHADLLVTHAPQQRAELARLRLDEIPLVEAFLPIFEPDDFGDPTPTQTIQAERMRLGEPDLVLLTYGAVRPYKGVDLAVEAMQFVDPSLDVRLVIAGKFWIDPAPIRERIAELGLGSRVVLHDGYQSDEATARHFDTADAVLLPYRSASQSGVVSVAFARARPVIATRVGGLPSAVRDGVDGLICDPEDPVAIARAIERFAIDRHRFQDGVRETCQRRSFGRYVEMIEQAVRAR